ncbi:MAG: DEAD/DEAH box helicase [Prevotellaceae bacterium]|jgi:superfamily II DNA/RNA helicase|nr:DEAD/DEAH box helicase [Prevotellaceae bacterium]
MIDIAQILANLHIDRLNPMQTAMLESYPAAREVILLSPTGSGKTLAYLLPLLATLNAETEGVQAVVLVPSRELALQTESVFKGMGTPYKIMSCYGGRPAMEEHRTMRNLLPAVIVGTPGRMNDHLQKQNFEVGSVKTLVIDEFDKSLELGFQDEMGEVISLLPAVERRVLLSATDTDEIPSFTGVSKERAVTLDFSGDAAAGESRLTLYRVESPVKDKLETLYELLCRLGDASVLVFCNYRESVERVGDYLRSKGVAADLFHGGMEQPARERALYRFRGGSCNVLVSTDLAARGLDIPQVEHIVHYHLPIGEEAFTHRNGRTARWTATGNAYLLVGPEEELPEYAGYTLLYNMEGETPRPARPRWATLYIGRGKKEKLSRADVVGFLCKKGGLRADEVGVIDVKEHYTFAAVSRSRMKQLLTLVRGEKIKGQKTLFEEAK